MGEGVGIVGGQRLFIASPSGAYYRADMMKPPFASVAEVMTATMTEFGMDKASAGWIAPISGVDISQYVRKGRISTQRKSRIYIWQRCRWRRFVLLIIFLLMLAMFRDDMQSFAAREQIVLLHARIYDAARTTRDYYNIDYDNARGVR